MITVINGFVFYHEHIGISDMIDTANKSWLIDAYRGLYYPTLSNILGIITIHYDKYIDAYRGLSQFIMINILMLIGDYHNSLW